MEKQHKINILDKGHVVYVDHFGSDQRIVESARVSYKSQSKGEEQDKKLLFYLWKNKHSTPFEQTAITLNIRWPIFLARQAMRHRTASWNEISGRYAELPNDFYIPNTWRKQDTENKQGSSVEEDWNKPYWDMLGKDGSVTVKGVTDSKNSTFTRILEDHCNKSYSAYQLLLDNGCSKEMARMVLPLNLYTECYVTWDIRNLLHFITLREDAHAQAEIQEYAVAIKSILQELFPWTLEAYEKYKWTLVE